MVFIFILECQFLSCLDLGLINCIVQVMLKLKLDTFSMWDGSSHEGCVGIMSIFIYLSSWQSPVFIFMTEASNNIASIVFQSLVETAHQGIWDFKKLCCRSKSRIWIKSRYCWKCQESCRRSKSFYKMYEARMLPWCGTCVEFEVF